MAKGMFSQGFCILLSEPVELDQVQEALQDFTIDRRIDESDTWEFSGPAVRIPYRPEVNGAVLIDTVDRKWPDSMGSPEEPTLFGAWSMGHFGPFAFPLALERACQQSWRWAEGRQVQGQHQAFLRVRLSYVFGAADDAKVLPDEYSPLAELEFLTRIVSALLELPQAICYFNPNGEVLAPGDELREMMNFAWSNELPALDAWSNVRLFIVNPEWSLMDTVGNSQLDLPDIEACFPSESFDNGEIDGFLRNVTLYLLRQGEVIRDGDTMDGPGGCVWQARQFKNGVTDPPRPVMRWFPLDDSSAPEELLTGNEDEEGEE